MWNFIRDAMRCCDLWQRYKKKAIHNSLRARVFFIRGVVTYDKDTKRKQFTTFRWGMLCSLLVLWPMTKIQKESNSQPGVSEPYLSQRCCDLWQRYKKKAIHNLSLGTALCPPGVVTYDKDTKRKQFTTSGANSAPKFAVLWPMTKIQKFMTGQENTLRGNPDLPFLCASRMGRDFFLYGDRFFCFLSLLKFLYCPASRESLSLRE